MADSLSRTLARYVASLEFEALPPEVVDKIKASLLHALIVAIIGAETTHGQAAIQFAKKEENKSDGATILVDGGRATRFGAAFANSKLMHATNQSGLGIYSVSGRREDARRSRRLTGRAEEPTISPN